jgi:hypothetical protein
MQVEVVDVAKVLQYRHILYQYLKVKVKTLPFLMQFYKNFTFKLDRNHSKTIDLYSINYCKVQLRLVSA